MNCDTQIDNDRKKKKPNENSSRQSIIIDESSNSVHACFAFVPFYYSIHTYIEDDDNIYQVKSRINSFFFNLIILGKIQCVSSMMQNFSNKTSVTNVTHRDMTIIAARFLAKAGPPSSP